MTKAETLIAAKMAERTKAGLKVILTDTGWEGYFATIDQRDEFVDRVTRLGRPAKLP